MDLLDAEKVINDYGDILANSVGTVYPISNLPFSKEKIKEAIKSYYAGCSVIGIIDRNTEAQLKTGYIYLAAFINDEKAKICLEAIPGLSEEQEIRQKIRRDEEDLRKEFQDIVKYSETLINKESGLQSNMRI